MRSKLLMGILGAGVSLLLANVQLGAHHSFAAEYDANKPVAFTGTVSKMEWINPHAWIHVDVKKPDGKVEKWAVEAGPPGTLVRAGFTKDSLPIGTQIKVTGFRAKDGALVYIPHVRVAVGTRLDKNAFDRMLLALLSQERVQLQAPLLGEGSEVLEDLIVGGSRREDLLDLLVSEHQGRASADDRGQENVSVGDELHDASSATPRNLSARRLRRPSVASAAGPGRCSACRTALA